MPALLGSARLLLALEQCLCRPFCRIQRSARPTGTLVDRGARVYMHSRKDFSCFSGFGAERAHPSLSPPRADRTRARTACSRPRPRKRAIPPKPRNAAAGSRGGRSRRKPGERTADRAEEKPARAEEKPRRAEREGGRQARTAPANRDSPVLPPPAERELVVSVDVGEQRVAVLEDDKVAEVYLERDDSRSIAGNIYKGTVDNVLPGMEAAFVEIGLEKNGFLYVDEIVTPELEGRRHGRKIRDLLSRGEELLVQAVKDRHEVGAPG